MNWGAISAVTGVIGLLITIIAKLVPSFGAKKLWLKYIWLFPVGFLVGLFVGNLPDIRDMIERHKLSSMNSLYSTIAADFIPAKIELMSTNSKGTREVYEYN